MREWNLSKNNGLLPFDILPQSNKKVWWKCSEGHEWQARVDSRTNGNKCPYCSGRKASAENNLLLSNPELAKEWNSKRPIVGYTSKSREKVLWKCIRCKETWIARIDSRTCGYNGCPYCSGRNATKTDNLLIRFPLLCQEWDFSKNNLGPDKYKSRSDFKAWWKCKTCNHEWQTTISHRVEGTGCPACSKIILNNGFVCDSVTEAFYCLKLIENKIDFEQRKNYPSSRMLCDFYLPKENKYIEVTGYHSGSKMSTNNGYFSYFSYLRKIARKRKLCNKNDINFEYLEIILSQEQIHYVRNQTKHNGI